MKRIASRDNAIWKSLVRLCHSSRDRRKSGKCVLEGAHAILACIERHGPPDTIVMTTDFVTGNDAQALVGAADERTMIVVEPAMFGELSQTATPAGVVAIVPTPQPRSTTPGAFSVLLDDIQDPGNVGTILRSAAAAGVSHAFLSAGCAFAWAPKVLRAGQGAHFFVDIVEDADLATVAGGFDGKIVATVPRAATSVFDADLTGPLMFAIGNEGSGLSDALRRRTTLELAIPMPSGFESLNAASAAAICLFEKVRQEDLRRR